MEPVPERPDSVPKKEHDRGRSTESFQRTPKRPATRTGDDQTERHGSRSGRAYIPLEGIADSGTTDAEAHPRPARKGWRRSVLICLVVAMIVAGVGGGAYFALQHAGGSPAQVLVLSAGDTDQQLTQQARSALLNGEVPSYLRNASKQVLDQIKNGDMNLVRKQLFDPSKAAGIMVHVYVTINGQLAITDVLTEEHPEGTVLPVSPASVTRLHFVVDSAGANGTVICGTRAANGVALYTAPMATGGQADLELTTR